MNASDLATYLGFLLSAWATGFSAGYVLTTFNDAMRHAS